MQIFKNFKNPITWLFGFLFKYILIKIFFSTIEKNDFNSFLSFILDLLPQETFISIFKLMWGLIMSKPSEILNFKFFHDVLIHTIPSEQRADNLGRFKFLFIILLLWNILKRSLFLIKTMIIWPFKLGIYSFLASLIGIRPDYFLSFFDIFKFNLPNWTYQKLVGLHLSWMTWFKNTLQINSINTDLEKPIPLPRIKNLDLTIESKPETYLYLTKTQWFYVSISIVGLLAAYFGYTGGLPFTKGFSWESKGDDGFDQGGDNIYIRRERPQTWTEYLKNGSLNLLNRINPITWKTAYIPIESEDIPEDKEIELRIQNDRELLNKFRSMDERQTPEYMDNLRREQKVSNRFSNWIDNNIDNHEPEAVHRRNPYTEKEKKSSWLSWFWKSHDEAQLEKFENLANQGKLDVIDRDKLRNQYQGIKGSSPTHSDPEVTKEYNRLFPKPEPEGQKILNDPLLADNSIKASGSNTKDPAIQNTSPTIRRKPVPSSPMELLTPINTTSLYSKKEGNDSTETITPINYNKKDTIVPDDGDTDWVDDKSPTDVTASELRPLSRPESPIEDDHSYPPKPKGKGKVVNYSPGEGYPFARGFTENIYPNLNPSLKRNDNYWHMGLSARFLDNFKPK